MTPTCTIFEGMTAIGIFTDDEALLKYALDKHDEYSAVGKNQLWFSRIE